MAVKKRSTKGRKSSRKASPAKRKKKLYTVSRGLKRYNFHNSQHTGSMSGYKKRGSTAKSTIVWITPSQHFKGEAKRIARRADKIRPASKPIKGTSHVRAFKPRKKK